MKITDPDFIFKLHKILWWWAIGGGLLFFFCLSYFEREDLLTLNVLLVFMGPLVCYFIVFLSLSLLLGISSIVKGIFQMANKLRVKVKK